MNSTPWVYAVTKVVAGAQWDRNTAGRSTRYDLAVGHRAKAPWNSPGAARLLRNYSGVPLAFCPGALYSQDRMAPTPEPDNKILDEIRALRADVQALPDQITKTLGAALWRLFWVAWVLFATGYLTIWLAKKF